MAKLKELLTCPWQEIKEQLLKHYPDQEQSIIGYEEVYNNLQSLDSIPDDMTICVCGVEDWYDGTFYVDVSGKKENDPDNNNWALEFTDWREWLGMEVHRKSLDEYTIPELWAHILYEMTYMGYSNDAIIKAGTDLDEKYEEILQDVNK